jgi:DNA polymerase-3 subunit epsilon
MRQIALDTETTGLSTEQGHRIIEIGCTEIINRKITGSYFHRYLNPEREVDTDAFNVHGISNEFLNGKPKFNEIFDQLVAYLKDGELIIHNAPFDVGFINYEFSLLGHRKKITDYCKIFDTLGFARERHRGQRNSLDALCKRYEVDNSERKLHGALLDSDLLARVYLAMTGGQGSLFAQGEQVIADKQSESLQLNRRKPLPIMSVTAEEEQAHLEFLELLKQSSGRCFWED